MTQSWISKAANKEIEKKYFFSDYRVEDGLLVAHKVIVEQNGKVVAETEIKKFQFNPTFKADFFEVKGK
jgi:outer membrane lipoprotein-sorting protein